MAAIKPVLDAVDDVDDVEGDDFDIDHDENFPSGSAWGQEQLDLLGFPIQPERLSFDVLTLECALTEAHLRFIQTLKAGFGVPMEDWSTKEVEGFYRDFYDSLQEMMPRIRPKQATPHKKPLRSSLETIPLSSPALPGSSHKSRESNISAIRDESDSEDSVTTPASNQTTPSRPRKRARLGGSPNPLGIRNDETEAANCPENTAVPMSSQTDKTYNESDKSSNNSGDDISQGDRPEIDVTVLIHGMLRHICKAHAAFVKDYTFSVKFKVERLTIPIAGLFPRTIPDLLITMSWNGRVYSLFDYEGKRKSTGMTKEQKFGREVAHLLGRANMMKSNTDHQIQEYKVVLISAHHMQFCISTCDIQHKYLWRLSTDLPPKPGQGKDPFPHVVHQYGPLDLFETDQRLRAVEAIYKLMVLQATDIMNNPLIATAKRCHL